MQTETLLGLSEAGFHRIVYTEWGNPTTIPPVICVHGLTRNRHDFDSLSYSLSNQGLHLYCPDIAGRGDSDWLKEAAHYNFPQYCQDMNALIARTASPDIYWIGTSMGGLIGMMLAGMPDSPIKKLVLNDIGPFVSSGAMLRITWYARRKKVFSSLKKALKYYKRIYADFGPLSETEWQDLVTNSIYEIKPGKFTSKMDPKVTANSSVGKAILKMLCHPIKTLTGTIFEVDLWKIWEKITCPVLVIHGKRSDVLRADTIEKMRTTHPELEVLEVEDAGHAPALLDITQQQIIYDWLTRGYGTSIEQQGHLSPFANSVFYEEGSQS